MLVNADDIGLPLQPVLIGASAAQHAGQWVMALQVTPARRSHVARSRSDGDATPAPEGAWRG